MTSMYYDKRKDKNLQDQFNKVTAEKVDLKMKLISKDMDVNYIKDNDKKVKFYIGLTFLSKLVSQVKILGHLVQVSHTT